MSIEMLPIDDEQARSEVRLALGLLAAGRPDARLGPEVCAEALRVSLWRLWSSEGQPPYVTRLINAAARTLMPWAAWHERSDFPIEKQLRQALDDMEEVGDVVALSGGRWAPTPLRAVRLAAIDRFLLLGGAPSERIPAELRALIDRAGVARLAPKDPGEFGITIPQIAEAEWLRRPEQDLAAWTAAVLDGTTLAPAGDLEVQFYRPAAAPRADQYFRWQDRPRRLPDGRYLGRRRMLRGSQAFLVVQIIGDKIIGAGAPILGDGDVRRLMYGVDALADAPVRVTLKRGSICKLTLRSALPRAEQRLLLTIGREIRDPEGKFYPRVWEIAPDHTAIACEAIRALGVRIDVR